MSPSASASGQFVNYPFDSHFHEHDRNGLRQHFLDEGAADAPPVVMVHGNPTWSFYYRRLVLALRDRYRCLVPDHMGMGLSDQPGDDRYEYTLGNRVADLSDLLETQIGNHQKVTLVLHDWGGMIGMAWAVQHWHRIERIVILNTAAFGLPTSKPMPWQLTLCRSPLGALLVRGFNAFCLDAVRRSPMGSLERKGYLAPYRSWDSRRAVHRFVQDIPLTPQDKAWGIVQGVEANLYRFANVPMQIHWGMQDFIFDHHFLAQWESRFPHAQVYRYEDKSHYILEDAYDQVIPKIEQFLA